MKLNQQWKWSTRGILLAAAIALLFGFSGVRGDHKQGHNPGGGSGGGGGETPPPGGIVYFIHDGSVWTMNADGSNRAPTILSHQDTWADPSRLSHAGARWFANRVVPDGASAFPNGHLYVEIEAVAETGTVVPLVAQADIEVLSPAVWMTNDLSVSFIGERWLLDEGGQPTAPVEAGLYVVAVSFDADGAVGGGVPGSLTFVADLSTELHVGPGGFVGHEVAGHSWSPDQSAFTFGVRSFNSSPSHQEIWIVDLSLVANPHAVPPEALFLLDSGNGIGWPEWSPDGSHIGYVSWDGTVVYDVFRNRSRTLKRTPNDGWGITEWSPDGSHFVLYHWDNFSGYDGIYRFTADITGKTELTAGLCPPDAFFDCVLIPLGWRE
jgi:hypothetical protein